MEEQKRGVRPPLGKITMSIRVRPRTRDQLQRLAQAEQITVSDYVEAVLIHHFEAISSE